MPEGGAGPGVELVVAVPVAGYELVGDAGEAEIADLGPGF